MQTAKILQFRKSEEDRQLITQGMLDWEEQRFTAEMEKLKADAHTPDPGYKDHSKPQSWAEWYDEHYMDLFDGTGFTIMILVLMLLFLIVYVNLSKVLGW